MAKGFDIGLAKQPEKPNTETIRDFIEITESNIKNAIITGRIIYTIETNVKIVKKTISSNYNIVHFLDIKPRFTKGWWKMPYFPWDKKHPYSLGKEHFRMFWPEDWDYESWTEQFKVFNFNYKKQEFIKMSEFIKLKGNKRLYLKPTDPILTYYKE